MAYQFMHVEGYARAAGKGKAGSHTVRSIVAEAEREEGACPHIAEPKRPRVLFGVAPHEAAEAAERWAEAATDSLGRKLRKDGLCMVGGVASLPDESRKVWKYFAQDTIRWLQEEYGDRLLSVVEHLDEKHPHLHFYAVPKAGERFDAIHDGFRAANKAAPHHKTAQDRKNRCLAYSNAMRAFQDRFYSAVAGVYGLLRTGPGRRRLTRKEYEAEKHERQVWAAKRGQDEKSILALLHPDEIKELQRRSEERHQAKVKNASRTRGDGRKDVLDR